MQRQRISLPHPNRRSPRLRGFDYKERGSYFVTVCTAERVPIFGEIQNELLVPSAAGEIVEQTWHDLPNHFENVEQDAFVIMPNHVHGVLTFLAPVSGRVTSAASTNHGLSTVVGAFKSYSAKRINVLRGAAGTPVWQPRFHDHIIRGERDLNAIREYITNNPLKWALDKDNAANWHGTPDRTEPPNYGAEALSG